MSFLGNAIYMDCISVFYRLGPETASLVVVFIYTVDVYNHRSFDLSLTFFLGGGGVALFFSLSFSSVCDKTTQMVECY